jgi:hypothetical protein
MKNSIIIVAIFLVAIAAIILLNSTGVANDPYTMTYGGEARHFRANLFEANKTLVYPADVAIKQVLINPEVYKIQIAYIPNATENAYYLAATYEITNKLGLVYRQQISEVPQILKDSDGSSCLLFFETKKTVCFRSVPINSTDELVPTTVEPVILMLGPSQTNQTAVTVYSNFITLEGASFNETYRVYTDLDLAVDKMLLVLMSGQ